MNIFFFIFIIITSERIPRGNLVWYSNNNNYFFEYGSSDFNSPDSLINKQKELGTLYKVIKNENPKKIWSREMPGRINPSHACVSNNGKYVVTMGDSKTKTCGENQVVIFGPRGKIIRSLRLDEITDNKDILNREINFAWHRGANIDDEQEILVIKVIKEYEMLLEDVQICDHVFLNLKNGKLIEPSKIKNKPFPEEDEAAIFKLVYESAIVKKTLPFFKYIEFDLPNKKDTIWFASDENINGPVERRLMPNRLVPLGIFREQDLKICAGIRGDFLCIRFHDFYFTDTFSKIYVSAAWVKAKPSEHPAGDEGGLIYELKKVNNKWEIKNTLVVVRTHWDGWENELISYHRRRWADSLYRYIFYNYHDQWNPLKLDTNNFYPDIRVRLNKFINRFQEFQSSLKAPKKKEFPVLESFQKMQSMERTMYALIDTPNIKLIAKDYIRDAKIYYEYEGASECPLDEAKYAEDYLRNNPDTPLKPYIDLFLIHRLRIAYELLYQEKKPNDQMMVLNKYWSILNNCTHSPDTLIQYIARSIDNQPFLFYDGAPDPSSLRN